MMKLKSLIKITIFVITGFCLLCTDNNVIATQICNQIKNDKNNKAANFLFELYNYWKENLEDYSTFLGIKSGLNKKYKKQIHDIYLDSCISMINNELGNEAYAIVNNTDGNNVIVHHNFNDKIIPNNLENNKIRFERYQKNLSDNEEYSNFINVLINCRNSIYWENNISEGYFNYINLLENLYIQMQNQNDINVINKIRTKLNINCEKLYNITEHNISKDREYQILMSVIYETRDSFLIPFVITLYQNSMNNNNSLRYNIEYLLIDLIKLTAMYKNNDVIQQIFNELTGQNINSTELKNNIENFIQLLKILYDSNNFVCELKQVLSIIKNRLQSMEKVSKYTKYDSRNVKIEYDMILSDLIEELNNNQKIPEPRKKLNKIINALEHVKNIKNIELFTYKDMCPACWSVWNKYIQIVKKLNIFDKDFRVDVYSTIPYDATQHAFYEVKQPIQNIIPPNYNYKKWYKIKALDHYPYRISNLVKQNQLGINKYIDRDGISIYRTIMNDNIYKSFVKYYFYNKINSVDKDHVQQQIQSLFSNIQNIDITKQLSLCKECIDRLKKYNTLSELIYGERATVQILSIKLIN